MVDCIFVGPVYFFHPSLRSTETEVQILLSLTPNDITKCVILIVL